MSARALRLLPVVATAAALMAGAPAATAKSKEIAWEPCGDAPNVECAIGPRPAGLRPAPRRSAQALRGPLAGDRRTLRLAVLELRRPGRHGRRLLRGPRRRRLPGAQRALRPHRHGPAWRRPEQAVDRLQGQPGDDWDLLAAVHDAVQPRRGRADREGPPLHQTLHRAQRLDPRPCLDRQRGARHGPRASKPRRPQDQLPRLLVRHVPRRHVREPVPEALPGDGPRRPARREGLHQPPDAGPARAVGRLRAGPGPLLPGVRRPIRAPACGFGGTDPWGAYDELIDAANASPLPATGYTPDPRPVDGDDVLAAALFPLYAKQLWPLLAEALAAADRPATGRSCAFFVDEFFYGRDPDTGRSTRAPIGTSRSARASSVSQPASGPTSRPATTRGGSSTTSYWNLGYIEFNYGLWPIRDRDAFNGPFRIARSSPTPLVVATKYDPATTLSRRASPGPPAREGPPADDVG